jgi:hypothetical protein
MPSSWRGVLHVHRHAVDEGKYIKIVGKLQSVPNHLKQEKRLSIIEKNRKKRKFKAKFAVQKIV